MGVSLYDQSPIDRCLGCFQYFAITNKAAVYTFIFSVDSSDEFPSRMDGQRELIYDFDRCWQIALPKGCAHFTPVSCIWNRDPCQQKFITPLKSSVVLICFPYYEWCSVYSQCINNPSYFHFHKVSIHILHAFHFKFLLLKFLGVHIYQGGWTLACDLGCKYLLYVWCLNVSTAFGCKTWKWLKRLDEVNAEIGHRDWEKNPMLTSKLVLIPYSTLLKSPLTSVTLTAVKLSAYLKVLEDKKSVVTQSKVRSRGCALLEQPWRDNPRPR